MLISKFTAKVDVSQTTVTLIFRKLKNDERDQDRERKFVPKRLGTGMDAKTVNRGENQENRANNFSILLFTNICEMEYIANRLSSVINLNEFRPFTIIFHARSKHD